MYTLDHVMNMRKQQEWYWIKDHSELEQVWRYVGVADMLGYMAIPEAKRSWDTNWDAINDCLKWIKCKAPTELILMLHQVSSILNGIMEKEELEKSAQKSIEKEKIGVSRPRVTQQSYPKLLQFKNIKMQERLSFTSMNVGGAIKTKKVNDMLSLTRMNVDMMTKEEQIIFIGELLKNFTMATGVGVSLDDAIEQYEDLVMKVDAEKALDKRWEKEQKKIQERTEVQVELLFKKLELIRKRGDLPAREEIQEIKRLMTALPRLKRYKGKLWETLRNPKNWMIRAMDPNDTEWMGDDKVVVKEELQVAIFESHKEILEVVEKAKWVPRKEEDFIPGGQSQKKLSQDAKRKATQDKEESEDEPRQIKEPSNKKKRDLKKQRKDLQRQIDLLLQKQKELEESSESEEENN